jgi:CheY-like chemotaxis protein
MSRFMPGRRVLIAEGDETQRELLRKRLFTLDVLPDVALDGREALQKIAEQDYAIVVVDLTLPVVDATGIIDRVRDLPAARRPMILVTADRGVQHALDTDLVQIVLRKPFDARQIADVIASCLSSLRGRSVRNGVNADDDRDPAAAR